MSTFTAACKQGQCDKLLDDYQTSSWVDDSTNAEPWWPQGKGGLWGDPSVKPSASGGSCNFDGGVPIGTFTGTANIPGVAIQPEYLIEQFTRGRDTYYRITARGFGLDERTQVVLQTYFRPFTVQ
jgi:type IV pilus assembly protein PilX